MDNSIDFLSYIMNTLIFAKIVLEITILFCGIRLIQKKLKG